MKRKKEDFRERGETGRRREREGKLLPGWKIIN